MDTIGVDEPSTAAGSQLDAGVLNQLLREQLSPTKAKSPSQTESTAVATQQTDVFNPSTEVIFSPVDLTLAANTAARELLLSPSYNRPVLHDKLSQLYYQQKALYQQTDMEPALREQQFISRSGLVLSPDNCMTTVLDDIRVRAFARGVDQALADKIPHHEGPVRVAYPACGPCAPLLVPLLAHYKATNRYTPEQLQVAFIDIQPGAIEMLRGLLEHLQIGDYVQALYCEDALDHQPTQPYDLFILEAMQHGFTREGQLSLARHFAGLLSADGDMVPQQVTVSAKIASCQRELVEQWQGADEVSQSRCDPQIQAERIPMGEVLQLSADWLRDLPVRRLDEHTELVQCNALVVPPIDREEEVTLMFCTEVQVWGDERIGEYDSGITHPLPDQSICINFKPKKDLPGDLLVNSGDTLQFFYRLNGLPGFLPVLMDGGEA